MTLKAVDYTNKVEIMIKATKNQMGVVKNPYQTSAHKVLCVCSAGILRSPTMANVLHQEFGFNTRSAGSCEDFALIPVSEALIAWADEIVVVEAQNMHEIEASYQVDCPVFCLNLSDDYEWNDSQLRELIKIRYRDCIRGMS